MAGSSSPPRRQLTFAVAACLSGVLAGTLVIVWTIGAPSAGICPFGDTCVGGEAYQSTAWSAPRCGPGGPFTFEGVKFTYFYSACYSPGGDSIVINGTESGGASYQLSFGGPPRMNEPAIVTELSPDGKFGFQLGVVDYPLVTLLVEAAPG
jgi:hypothetical protein